MLSNFFKKLLFSITIYTIHATASPLAVRSAAKAVTVNPSGAFNIPLDLPNGHYTLSLPTGNSKSVPVYPKIVLLEKDVGKNSKPNTEPSAKKLQARHHTLWSPLCLPELALITQDSYHYVVKATPSMIDEYWGPGKAPRLGYREISFIRNDWDTFLFCQGDKSGETWPALASEYYEADGTIDGVCGSRRSGGAGQVGRSVGYARVNFNIENTPTVSCDDIVYLGEKYEKVGELVDGYMRDSA